MNLIVLQEFFESYSLGSIIMAVAIGLINFLVDKLLSKKVKGLTHILPFLLGVLFNYLCGLIFNGNTAFNGATISAGIVSGSLSFALKGILCRILKGNSLPNGKRAIVITGLIEGHVKQDCVDVVVNLIEQVFTSIDGQTNVQESEVISQIALHISRNSRNDGNKTDFIALASLIFASVKQTEHSK